MPVYVFYYLSFGPVSPCFLMPVGEDKEDMEKRLKYLYDLKSSVELTIDLMEEDHQAQSVADAS